MRLFCHLYVFFSIAASIVLGLVISPFAFFVVFGITSLGCAVIAITYEILHPNEFYGLCEWQKQLARKLGK